MAAPPPSPSPLLMIVWQHALDSISHYRTTFSTDIPPNTPSVSLDRCCAPNTVPIYSNYNIVDLNRSLSLAANKWTPNTVMPTKPYC